MRITGFVFAGFLIGYGYRTLVILAGGPAHGWGDVAFFSTAGVFIYAVAYVGAGRTLEQSTWYCPCGHDNGRNLAICAACGRPPGAKN